MTATSAQLQWPDGQIVVVGWASVFLLAHQLGWVSRGQTIKPSAHPTGLEYEF
jgi:hypothetical protein